MKKKGDMSMIFVKTKLFSEFHRIL